MQMEMTGWVGVEGRDRFQILDIRFEMKDKRLKTKDQRHKTQFKDI